MIQSEDDKLWVKLFSLVKTFRHHKYDAIDRPLTSSILGNPHHDLTKAIVNCYSMQSFIFSKMNKVIRNKDFSSIEIFGPFASFLGYIIQVGAQNHPDQLPKKFEVYRGMICDEQDIDSFQVNKIVSLKGFTSTSLIKDVALGFISDEIEDNSTKIGVLFVIKF